jgi:hypothetical protein
MMIASIPANAVHTISQCHGLIAPIGVSMGPGAGGGARHGRGGPKFIHANDSCGPERGNAGPLSHAASAPVNTRCAKSQGAGLRDSVRTEAAAGIAWITTRGPIAVTVCGCLGGWVSLPTTAGAWTARFNAWKRAR